MSTLPARRVWDPLVRILHAAFIVGVAAAWLSRHARGPWHEWIGYGVLAALAIRLVWGLVGTRPARFASFVRGPRATLGYARALLVGQAPRHLGHNPLGAWMIVALLLALALTTVSGWMSTTDRWWGVAWVADLHLYAAWAILALLPLHIAGALHASRKHRENLVAAMIHGRKRQTGPGDVDA